MAASLLEGLKGIMGQKMADAGIRLEGDEEAVDRPLGDNTGRKAQDLISLQYVDNLSAQTRPSPTPLVPFLINGIISFFRCLFSPALSLHTTNQHKRSPRFSESMCEICRTTVQLHLCAPHVCRGSM
jgi:hypothetical protein